MFKKLIVDVGACSFEELSNSVEFEDICVGRVGAVLVDCVDDLIPIIRTTAQYNKPAQKFMPIHYSLINQIKEMCGDVEFNNAMIEIYDSRYRKMGFHTDQSLDLADDSHVCLFSCYNDASNPVGIRKLIIQNKTTKEHSEVLLENNSAVLFSTSTNHEHLHKIVLEENAPDSKWLGITFRLSKTFVRFIDDVPHMHSSGNVLRIANNDEKREFYKHKSNENRSVGYDYPEITYTVSKSDMLPVI